MAPDDTNRRLPDAAGRSPEVAALLAGRHHDPSARYRRLAVAVVAGVIAIGLLWLAAASLSGLRSRGEQAREPAQEIDTSHYLSPLRTAVTGEGEEIAPFPGFAISVETEPPGGVVTIAGVPRGEAPVLANLDCKPGARLEISAEKAGFRPARAHTACREDALVKLTIRLAR